MSGRIRNKQLLEEVLAEARTPYHDRIPAARKGRNAKRIPTGLTYLLTTSFRPFAARVGKELRNPQINWLVLISLVCSCEPRSPLFASMSMKATMWLPEHCIQDNFLNLVTENISPTGLQSMKLREVGEGDYC